MAKTDGYEVFKLEKLYALLCQSIYRHRQDYNKTALVQVSGTRGCVTSYQCLLISSALCFTRRWNRRLKTSTNCLSFY